MKAPLLQILFFLNASIATGIVFGEGSKQDIRDLKEQNIMSVLYQQTAAEKVAGSLQTFRSAKQALDKALIDQTWSALPGQNTKDKNNAESQDYDRYEMKMNVYGEITQESQF